MTAASILLIREFLAGVLGQGQALELTSAPSRLWITVALLLYSEFERSCLLLRFPGNATKNRQGDRVEHDGTNDSSPARLVRWVLSTAELTETCYEGIRQDVAQMRMVVLSTARIVLEVLQAAGLIAAAMSLSLSLSLWAFYASPSGCVTYFAGAAHTRTLFRVEKRVALFDALLQLLHGVRVIKIYQGERAEGSELLSVRASILNSLRWNECRRSRGSVESLAALNVVVVAIVGSLSVMSGQLGWPELLAFLMAMRAAQGP